MKQAGVSGFDVTMTTFATPVDYAADVGARSRTTSRRSASTSTSSPQDSATFAARNGAGYVRLGSDRSRHARRRRRLRDRVPPGRRRSYQAWFPGYKGNTQMFRLIGNGRIVLDPKKRLPMYQTAQQGADGRDARRCRSISFSKFQVVSNKLKNMYVAFSDFNPGLRTAYLVKLRSKNERRGRPRRRPTLARTACNASSPSEPRLSSSRCRDLDRDLHAGPAAPRQRHRPDARRRRAVRRRRSGSARRSNSASPAPIRSSTGAGSATCSRATSATRSTRRSRSRRRLRDGTADHDRAGLPRPPDRRRGRRAARRHLGRPARQRPRLHGAGSRA